MKLQASPAVPPRAETAQDAPGSTISPTPPPEPRPVWHLCIHGHCLARVVGPTWAEVLEAYPLARRYGRDVVELWREAGDRQYG